MGTRNPKLDNTDKLFSRVSEAAVLGSMLIDSACIEDVSAIVQAGDFYLPEHKIIRNTILDLRSRGIPIDVVLLRDELEKRRQLEEVGGVEYLAKIMESVPSSANVGYYSRIVKEKSRYRQLVTTGEKINKLIEGTDGDIEESIYEIKQLAEGLDAIEPDGESQPIIKGLADVQPTPIDWFWTNKIPMGMLTEIIGDPDLGKSFLTLYMAAKISSGGTWPDGDSAPKGSVILLSGEDDLAKVIRPRLDSMGADVSKIIALEGVKLRDDDDRAYQGYFSLQRDMAALQQAVRNLNDCKLIVIDPLNCYLGFGIDTHRDADVRGILMPLVQFAEQFNIAIIGVRHLNKNSGSSKAIYRASGSLAFTAAARTSWLVSTDPNNPESKRRLLTPAKHNVLIDPSGLAFEIIGGRVVFEGEPVTITSDEALGHNTIAAPKKEQAVEWLKSILPKGSSLSTTELTRLAKEQGITEGTLRQAKYEAGIVSYPLIANGKKQWMVEIK